MTRLFESLALEDWKQNLYGEKAELGRDNPVFQSEPSQEGLELQVLNCLDCWVVRLGSRSSRSPAGSRRGWRGWRGCCPYRSCGAGEASRYQLLLTVRKAGQLCLVTICCHQPRLLQQESGKHCTAPRCTLPAGRTT